MSSPEVDSVDARTIGRHPGSFRDPASGVLLGDDGRVYRYFSSDLASQFSALNDTGLLPALVDRGSVLESTPLSIDDAPDLYRVANDVGLVVEHPRIPFVSYPYEWPLEMMKATALLHLDLMSEALERGFTLKDATPYNVQFRGPNPVLIDIGSFERYEEGAPWIGYSQFCRLFLNPLLLQAYTGVPYQPWLRGSPEGIEPAVLSPLLPLRRKLNPGVFMDVVLQAWLSRRLKAGDDKPPPKPRPIPKAVITGLVNRLRKSIGRLKRRGGSSTWLDYEAKLPYGVEALAKKDRLVEEALERARPGVVWDLGCNTGKYSMMAARHAGYVVAMDYDEASVGALFERAKGEFANLLPLTMDFLNPSPSQGWAQTERQGLHDRGPADFALCLALVHHLAIGGNVPLPRIVDWLAGIARAGVVEFVPKSDPMVQTLLRTRADVFGDYSLEAFEEALLERFEIETKAGLPGSERVLYVINAKP
jgi:hypothetical protein